MDRFKSLLEKLDIQFKQPDLLFEAFTHRSYLNEGGRKLKSNERLEFLGDAILSFLVSHHLYTKYPQEPEGMLTNLRSSIVKTETLSSISQELLLGKYLMLSHGEEKGGGRTNPSLLADTFEAFLGAIFLDQGLAASEKFLGRFLFQKIPEILDKRLHTDFKSTLQEIVQEYSDFPPTYKVIKTEGPDHAKTFWVSVVIDGKEAQTGVGRSKQEAEQVAAQATLENMGKI